MVEAARREDWPRTIEEFEAWHARQPERWEFIDGQPRLMAPASMKHTIIKNNVGFALRQAVAELGCVALVDGPQILTDEISAIPDVVVTCSVIDLSTPVIAEPAIIVEIMSPSSETDDAGRPSGSATARSRASGITWCCPRTSAWRRCTAVPATSRASASSAPAPSSWTTSAGAARGRGHLRRHRYRGFTGAKDHPRRSLAERPASPPWRRATACARGPDRLEMRRANAVRGR